MKKDEWTKMIAPSVLTWAVAIIVLLLMWLGDIFNIPSVIGLMIVVLLFLLIALFILRKCFSDPDFELEFHNDIKIKQFDDNENKILHVLYFTNNTGSDIAIDAYWYQISLSGKVLKHTGKDYHISGKIVEKDAKKQPIEFSTWINPSDDKISDPGIYQIKWKIAYSYKNIAQNLTSVKSLEWPPNGA